MNDKTKEIIDKLQDLYVAMSNRDLDRESTFLLGTHIAQLKNAVRKELSNEDTCPDCGGSGKDIRKCQTCGRIGCVYRGKGEGLAFEIGCEETCRTCKGKELSNEGTEIPKFVLCYSDGKYPFNREDLTLVDYGHSDNIYTLSSDYIDELITKAMKGE